MKTLILIISLLFLNINTSVAQAETETAYVDVNGLVCDFCARALEKMFGKQDEVREIKVDLSEKIITIQFEKGQNLEDDRITQIVNDSGYDVREIRREL